MPIPIILSLGPHRSRQCSQKIRSGLHQSLCPQLRIQRLNERSHLILQFHHCILRTISALLVILGLVLLLVLLLIVVTVGILLLLHNDV